MRYECWRRRVLWLAPFAILSAAAAAPAAAEWHFPIPAGWVDLSPGHPAPSDVPAHISAMAQTAQVFAVDPASAGQGYTTSMAVKVLPQGGLVVDDKTMGPLVLGIERGLHNEVPTAELTIVDKTILDVQGVKAFRVVADAAVPGRRTLRLLQYVIPGGESTATVIYTLPPASYDHYLPILEANTKAIQGAAGPAVAARIGHALEGTPIGDLDQHDREALFRAVGGTLGFLVVVAFFAIRKKRQQARQAQVPPLG